jgi:hypothetical protein
MFLLLQVSNIMLQLSSACKTLTCGYRVSAPCSKKDKSQSEPEFLNKDSSFWLVDVLSYNATEHPVTKNYSFCQNQLSTCLPNLSHEDGNKTRSCNTVLSSENEAADKVHKSFNPEHNIPSSEPFEALKNLWNYFLQ